MQADMRTCFWIVALAGILCGCDPVTRYQITSTIFDGVPRMPPAEEYCSDYHQNALAMEAEAEKKRQIELQKEKASTHPPYAEKRCDDCHDKTTDSGFITPRKELCGACHVDFLKGTHRHGPAAVGACQQCHEPHSSPNAKLLTRPNGALCGACHTEQRVAKGLHDSAKSRGVACTECHDPHAANNNYLLK